MTIVALSPTQKDSQPQQPDEKPSASVSKLKNLQAPGPVRMRRDDREFLPAALEILEQPASPLSFAFIWFISLGALCALAWSWFGWVDIHAVAQGRIQPSGRSKVVQPLEAGKVVTIAVTNGTRVKAGDLLIELDPTESAADREIIQADLDNARAEIARRKAALVSIEDPQARQASIAFHTDVQPAARQREQMTLDADVAQFNSLMRGIDSQIAERRAQQLRLRASVVEREKLIEALTERVSMRQQLAQRSSASRSQVIDAIQELQKEAATLASENGQLGELQAAIASLENKREETRSQARAEQRNRLNEAERRADKAYQDAIKAGSRSNRMRIVAPIDGTVQQLAVTTIGQVVNGAQPLMTLVPSEAPIEVEALVLNRDVGFVRPGQEVTVKVEAFPYTRFGTIEGKVVTLSDDAIDEREAATLADPSGLTKGAGGSALNPTPRLQNLVFPATISLASTSIKTEQKQIPLTPGMAVTVEIKTGQRRVIDYVLSPIREVQATAIRER